MGFSWYFVLLAVVGVALAKRSTAKPNIVLILTDDQDSVLDSMVAMNYVKNFIVNEGVTFKNAFVNTPICCPSRSTILTGKYLHNTGVRNNSLSGNCSNTNWQILHEPFTFTTLLKNSGYSTFYAGKYLNEYGNKQCGGTKHVPPGYDWWVGLKGNSEYYNYTLSINGTATKFTDEYLTDVMKNYALNFLNQKHVEESAFFMMLATPAAHAPFTAAPRHKDTFPGVEAIRTPAFNYSSNDKHWLIRMLPKFLPSDVRYLDDIQRHRLQTLLAVDEMVQEIILKLKSMNVLEDTYVIFTSDNGFHIGQFVQPWDKRQPYETDLRVPLVIRGPNIQRNSVSSFPVSTIDLAPSILHMAGLEIPQDIDGQSFLEKIITDSKTVEEKNILIEYFGEGDQSRIDKSCPWIYDENLTECTKDSWCKCQDSRNNTYTCVKRISEMMDFKFCKFDDEENFVEAYDLRSDPFELNNIYQSMGLHEVEDYMEILHKLKNCKGLECSL